MDKNLRALLGISLVAFVGFLEYTIVTTSLPSIQSAFQVSILNLQWVFNIYCIMLTAFMIICGRVGDIFGHRLVFYSGAVLLILGSLGAGASDSFAWLIFSRAVQSIGVAMVVTLAPSLIQDIYKDARRAMSFYGTVLGVALASGPLVGGWIVMHWGWRWIFYINVPLLLIGLLFCFSCVPESKAELKGALDIKGAVLIILSLASLIYGIVHGEQTAWLNSVTIMCLLVFLVASTLLVRVEACQKIPVLNFSFFKNPQFILASVSSATGGTLVTLTLFFAPLFLQRVLGYTPKGAGELLLVVPIAIVFISPFVAKIIGKMGLKKVLFMTPVLALVSAFLHLMFAYDHVIPIILVAFFIIGFAWAIVNVVVPMGAVDAIGQADAGVVIGTAYSLWSILAAVHLAITTVIFHKVYNSHLVLGKTIAFTAGFRAVFLYGVVTSAVLVLIGAVALSASNKK